MSFPRRVARVEMIILNELPKGAHIAEQVVQIEGFDYEPDEDYLETLRKRGVIHLIVWPAPAGPGIWMAATTIDDRASRFLWADIYDTDYHGSKIVANLVAFPERELQAVISNVNLPISAFRPLPEPARRYKLTLAEETCDEAENEEKE